MAQKRSIMIHSQKNDANVFMVLEHHARCSKTIQNQAVSGPLSRSLSLPTVDRNGRARKEMNKSLVKSLAAITLFHAKKATFKN